MNDRNAATSHGNHRLSASRLGRVIRHVTSDPWAACGLCIVAFFTFLAIFADVLTVYEPNQSFITLRLRGIGTEGHILGLDTQGRDVLTRLIYGARTSLVTGVVPVVISALISLPLGLFAGYYPRLGAIIMRAADVLFAFPMVLLAILLGAILGPGLPNLILAMVVVLLPFNTRVVYTEALAQRNRPYIDAAVALGTPAYRVLFREMLPHVTSATVVYSLTIVGTIIITAAGLSFLGLGIQPPTAEWGLMTGEGRTVLAIAPHIAAVPGVAIFALVMGFNFFGDGVKAAFESDPD